MEELKHDGYSNAFKVLYCAKQYEISGLEEKCRTYIENEIKNNNVCFIMEEVGESHYLFFLKWHT